MMTADQYREAIAALGLSLGSAARVFGINERTSRRFATGNDIPWYLEMLINIMVAKGVAPDEIKDIAVHNHMPRAASQLFHLMERRKVIPGEALAIGFPAGREKQAQ